MMGSDDFMGLALDYLRFTGVPVDEMIDLIENTSLSEVEALTTKEGNIMGGRPSKGTGKDMRLSRNNPNAGKAKPTMAPTPTQPRQPMNKQSKKGC